MAEQVADTYALPNRPIRVFAIALVKGGGDSLAMFTTCLDLTAAEAITRFASHWSIGMLRTLRKLTLRQHISKWALARPGSPKVRQLLENLVAMSS